MDRSDYAKDSGSDMWRWAGLGLVSIVLALLPSPGRADEPWAGSPRFGLLESPAGSAAGTPASQGIVAALTPGSVLLAQAGAVAPAAAPGGWQFTFGSYLWTPRTEIDLTVGPFSRSTTIDFFSDVTDHLNFGFTGHFEATWREWTALADLLYLKAGKDETTAAGIETDAGLRAGALRVRRDLSPRHPARRTYRPGHARGAGRRPADAHRRRAHRWRPVALANRDADRPDVRRPHRIPHHRHRRALVPGGRGWLRHLRQPERSSRTT